MSCVVVYKQWLEESERRVFQRLVKAIKENRTRRKAEYPKYASNIIGDLLHGNYCFIYKC